jgi:hypothetical protein
MLDEVFFYPSLVLFWWGVENNSTSRVGNEMLEVKGANCHMTFNVSHVTA